MDQKDRNLLPIQNLTFEIIKKNLHFAVIITASKSGKTLQLFLGHLLVVKLLNRTGLWPKPHSRFEFLNYNMFNSYHIKIKR